MRYITIGVLLLVACAKQPENRLTIPEQPIEAEQEAGKPCPSDLPKVCCKDMRACQ